MLKPSRRPPPSEVAMPPWMKLGVILFVALVIWASSKPREDGSSPLQTAIGNISQELPNKADYKTHLVEPGEEESGHSADSRERVEQNLEPR